MVYIFKLKAYRKPTNWTRLTIPADVYTQGPIYTQVYNLRGIRLASIYETAVLSRNRYGWSKPSAIYRFSTPGAGILIEVKIYI